MATRKQAPEGLTKVGEVRIVQSDKATEDRVPLPEMLRAATMREAPGLSPTVEWQTPGEWIFGKYLGSRPDIGPNKSFLHELAHWKTGEVVGVWGGTVLDRKVNTLLDAGQLHKGDPLLIQYTGDLAQKPGQNPARNYRVAVASGTAAK